MLDPHFKIQFQHELQENSIKQCIAQCTIHLVRILPPSSWPCLDLTWPDTLSPGFGNKLSTSRETH